MLELRTSGARGHVDHGWLDARHTFSFGSYIDRSHTNFRALRVINEDIIAPGQGFGTHPHKDMEIITYVLSGALEHKDSMGNTAVLRPGMIQRMSAGTGITHSEYNHSQSQPLHLLQVWIIPERQGVTPSYEDIQLNFNSHPGELLLVASKDAPDGVARINQDVKLYAARLSADQEISLPLSPQRYGWLQMAKGSGALVGQPLNQGDGVAIVEEENPRFRATSEVELLFFDLA